MKFKYLFALPLVAALTACSSDEPAPTPDGAEVPFYTTMSITLPSSNRADGPIEGEEVGLDSENKVNTLQVILTKREGTEGNYTYTKVIASNNGQAVDGTTYTVMFDAKELKNYPELQNDGMDVYAFVVCNDGTYTVTEGINGNFDIDATFTGGAATSYNGAPIRMTSAPYKARLPKVADLLKHDTQAKAYDLTAQVNGAQGGPVSVERSVARFDFKSKNPVGKGENTFPIKEGDVIRGYVQITDMALINENNEVYYFARTNNDGMWNTTPLTHQLVAGITNWGVTSASALQYVVSPKNLVDRVFNYPMASADPGYDYLTGLSFTSIASLTQDDNHTGTWDENSDPAKAEYKIWRYCNENVIPAMDKTNVVNNNQLNRYTTGIVFRGNILNGDGEDAISGYGADELYLFRQTLYGDFGALYRAAFSTGDKANPDLQGAFNSTWREKTADDDASLRVFTVVDGETTKEYVLIDQTAGFRGSKGFTVYNNVGTADAPNYPVYYFYWNRHDDNNQNNAMGAMEFSVVRNNVYKIDINSISMFGSSGTIEDPDKPDPDDPDEKEHMYIKVDVVVLPWTVRMNSIDL